MGKEMEVVFVFRISSFVLGVIYLIIGRLDLIAAYLAREVL